MTGELDEIEALCQAIRNGDPAQVAAGRREFAIRNWGFISVIDKLAQAHWAAGQYGLAAQKLGLITELMPDSNGFFLRRVYASLRAGVPGASEELARSAARIANDDDLFHAADHLVADNRPDLAARLLRDCRDRGVFSNPMLDAAQSRILYKTGKSGEAIALMKPHMEAEKPPLLAMRGTYLLMEDMLDFAEANRLGARTVLLWGDEWDLHHVLDRLLYIFRFSPAERLLQFFAQQYPEKAQLTNALLEKTGAAKASAQAALDAYGSVDSAAVDRIYEALSRSGTPAPRLLWGKQALVAHLYSGRLSEADYARFAWYLPNWEEGLIRDHVLSAARQTIPQTLAVQRGWLRYLIARSTYADAARQCLKLIEDDRDEDTLFFAIMLLRLNQDGVTSPFMEPELSEALRIVLLSRISLTQPGFRCVMHDHILALGGTERAWPPPGMPELSSRDAKAFRRLFAVKSGRLSRVSASPERDGTGPLRPVLAISGQLRGFETAWASIYKHLCQPVGAPVVMTVWDKSANALGRHARRLERALPDTVVEQLKPEERYTDAFERAYPETFRLVFGQTDVSAASLGAILNGSDCEILAVETESEGMVERLMTKDVSTNMLKMYYKFSRLEALIRESEMRTGEVFSHVVWTRPDCEILMLSPADLAGCLKRSDLVWSSFTNENTFGDYVMVLPRRAFAAIAAIFPRTLTAGDTVLMPWRPNRSDDPRQHTPLGAFGGPDVLFDTLLADGYVPLNRIPRMDLRLVGRTPGMDVVCRAFEAERAAQSRTDTAS